MSLGASLNVVVVVEDERRMWKPTFENVAVDCDIDGYRVDEEIIVDESGVIEKETL